MKHVDIENVKALTRFARSFVSDLHGGEVIGLVGELGAGKTAFVKAVAAALGVQGEVRSPTFILMQLFECGDAGRKKGVQRLCHVDAYRLENSRDLTAIGFHDYAGHPDVVTFVEWADRVPEIHTLKGYRELTFTFTEGESRKITFSA